jgi:hypothetical protein
MRYVPTIINCHSPCNNLDKSEAFYAKLRFTREGGTDDYRILSYGKGGQIHLTKAVEGWLVPGCNPFGIPENKPWGMYEFALSDPDETLVRIGWPTRLRH